MLLSVYLTHSSTISPYKYNEEAQSGVNISAWENCGKIFKKVKRRNEHVKSRGITFACDQCERKFSSKKILNGHEKQNTPTNLDISYVKNPLKTNRD